MMPGLPGWGHPFIPDSHTRGEAKVSDGTLFYGFSSVLNALAAVPGDSITIDLDFTALTATIAHVEAELEEDPDE